MVRKDMKFNNLFPFKNYFNSPVLIFINRS